MANINWYPGHMAKTKRLIKENINMIDVVYEVIDARIPYSSKIKDIDEYLNGKPKVLIMTKYDLCDTYETNKWVKVYEEQGYKVIFVDLENNPNMNKLITMTKELMEIFNAKRESKGMIVRKIRVIVVGIPNVGKSTLINRLVGKNIANVGNKPGITTSLNWIRINDDIELLDTPGILWPKLDEKDVAFNLATLTAIKEEILPIFEVIDYFLRTLLNYYPIKLKERYNLESLDEDITVNLDIIGKRRGCLVKGGIVDYDKVTTIIMNDIKDGLIKNITLDRVNK